MPTRRMFVRTALWLPPALLLATACSGARPGVSVTLDHGPPAALGGTMTFTLTATSVWDAPNNDPNSVQIADAKFGFLITEGLEFLTPGWSRQATQPGSIWYTQKAAFKAQQPQTTEVAMKVLTQGFHRVDGGATLFRGPSPSDSAVVSFYIKVTSLATELQTNPFPEQRASPTPAS